jgi:hypothetical protein
MKEKGSCILGILMETHLKMHEPTLIAVLGKDLYVFNKLEQWIYNNQIFPHNICLRIIIGV